MLYLHTAPLDVVVHFFIPEIKACACRSLRDVHVMTRFMLKDGLGEILLLKSPRNRTNVTDRRSGLVSEHGKLQTAQILIRYVKI